MTVIVAHRGWTADERENTRAAIGAAIDAGFGAVEFDVRHTRDGHWVLYHDADLARLDGRPDRVCDLTLEELQQGTPAPTLAEVLPLFSDRCTPLIEVKELEPVHAATLAATIAPHAEEYPLIIIARGEAMPQRLAAELPDVPIYLYHRSWQAAAEVAERLGRIIRGFDLPHILVASGQEEAALERLRGDDREVAVFTINDRATAERWLAAGVRWLITDVPHQLR